MRGEADVSDETPAPERRPILVGTGMPQTTLLKAFGQWVCDAFGETAYHVGSSLYGKTWRDVDVRLMLDDDEFHALFPGYQSAGQADAKWGLVCAAISALGQQQTGLPIDFQIQSATDANEKFGRGNGNGRNPLFLFNHDSAQAAIARRAEQSE